MSAAALFEQFNHSFLPDTQNILAENILFLNLYRNIAILHKQHGRNKDGTFY
jgi:hypothetical protein